MSHEMLPVRVAKQVKMKMEMLAEPASGDTTLKAYGRFALGMMFFISIDSRSELAYPGAPQDIIAGGSTPSRVELESDKQPLDDDTSSSRNRKTSLFVRGVQGVGMLAAAGVVGTATYLGMTATEDKPPVTPLQPSPIEQGYSTQQYTPSPESVKPTLEPASPTEYRSLLPPTQP